MVAMGIVPKPKDHLGFEATGVVKRVGSAVEHVKTGDRVFAVYSGLFATRKILRSQFVVKMPETLTFEQAVTMPIVYATVIYAVITLGQLQKGQVRHHGSFHQRRANFYIVHSYSLRHRRSWASRYPCLPNARSGGE